MKKTIIAVLAVVAMASCTKQDNLEGNSSTEREFEFTSGITTRVKSGNIWEAGDAIGIFAYDMSGGMVDLDKPLNNNVKYVTQSEGSIASFEAADEEQAIAYPVGNFAYMFFALYPYNPNATSFSEAILVDISDQSDLKSVDYLVADGGYTESKEDAVELTFAHMHSLVSFTFRCSAGVESLEGLSYEINNIQNAGVMGNMIGDETFTMTGKISDAKVADISQGAYTSLSSDMILFPTMDEETTDAVISVCVNGKRYEVEFDTALESGRHYHFCVTIGQTKITIGESTITDWGGTSDADNDLTLTLDE